MWERFQNIGGPSDAEIITRRDYSGEVEDWLGRGRHQHQQGLGNQSKSLAKHMRGKMPFANRKHAHRKGSSCEAKRRCSRQRKGKQEHIVHPLGKCVMLEYAP